MKIIKYFLFFLLTTSSCAVYTKSNVKVRSNRKEINTLEVTDYKDVNNGYTNFLVSTPFPIFNQQLSSIESFIPVGLEVFVSSKKAGDFELYSYHLFEGFEYKSDQKYGAFNYLIPRNEHRIIYAYPVWRVTKTIDRYKLDIGSSDDIRYYAIMPTPVDIELSLRGGVEYNMTSFFSGRIDEYFRENQPNLYEVSGYKNVMFRTFNTSLKIGAIFQRKIATRFNTNIKGKHFHSANYLTEGFYADFSILLAGDKNKTDVEYKYFNNGNTLDLQTDIEHLSMDMLFKKRFIGLTVGYKRYVSGRKVGIRMRFEAGLQPGFFPTLKSSFFANVGFGIGIGKWK